MHIGLRLVLGIAVAAGPSASFACSCSWFFFGEKEAKLRAAAAEVDLVVVGQVLDDSTKLACQGAVNSRAHVYQTLKVIRAIKGTAQSTLKVRVGMVTPTPQGCVRHNNSCEVQSGTGQTGVWALVRREDDWQFADVCATDAVRRIATLDGTVRAGETGGEIDSVRRWERATQ